MISHDDRLLDLLGGLCNDNLSLEEERQLADLLRDEPDARRMYVRYMDVHLALTDLDLADGEVSDSLLADALDDEETAGGDFSVFPYSGEIPPLTEPDMPDGRRFGLVSYFSQVGPLSYMVAMVIMCAMLLTAWAYKITHNDNLLTVNSTPAGIEKPPVEFVGHITGMKDCRWGDEGAGTIVGASVPMGREYALAAGLLEITYNTGARVILEGPCEYRVDSPASGRLQYGKLAARVEKRGEKRDEWGERSGELAASAASAKPQAMNSQSPVPSPQPPAPLFAITTPTAIVTDLGTEFGVEVSENGDTLSHVFQGAVRVDVIAGKAMESVVLHKDESARAVSDENGVRISRSEVGTTPKFVRQLTKPLRKLDLLDIVAGGDGLGSRRERGIDPTTGMEDTFFFSVPRGGHRQYRPVDWHPMVDGVFIPDGQEGAVQVDSTGGVFDGFPHTAGETSCTIWARAADVEKQHQAYADIRHKWVYHILRTEQYMPEGLGLLAMHSNAGITFDLEAIRRAHKGVALSRFHAVAALAARPPPPGGWGVVMKLDVWVLVDGELKFKRVKLRIEDDPVDVNVELGPNDHFLTLAITDHDRDRRADGGIFGDPVLELTTSDK